ncbi:uncharacterized protein TM35_001161010, partial [Trypanosoma theileri]
MMLLRRLLFFMALLLSVACVCVAASEETKENEGQIPDDGDCSVSGKKSPKCKPKPEVVKDSPECADPPGEENCPTVGDGSEDRCPQGSETPCSPKEPAPTTPKEPANNQTRVSDPSGGEPGAAIIPNSDSGAGENQEVRGGKVERDAAGQTPLAQIPATSTATTQPVNGEKRDPVLQRTVDTGTGVQHPIAEVPAAVAGEGSNGSSPSEGQTGANVNNPAGEAAVNAESTAAAQPTSPSPESSDTETANGSGTANDGGGTTP